MNLSRRRFVQGMMAGVAGSAVALAELPAEEALTIVDTHQHLWDLGKFKLPWIRRGDKVLDRNFLLAEYLEATRGLNVVKAVYMEVAVEASQRLAEAEWVVRICERGDTPTVAAVIGGSPGAADFSAYIGRFKGSRFVKGVREGFRRNSAADGQFLKGIRLLGEMGMSFDVLTDADGLDEAARLTEACPGTRFIVDHCGNPNLTIFGRDVPEEARARRRRWEEGMAKLADRANVVCKISGIVESVGRKPTAEEAGPVINHCLDRFGAERVMFSGNWPVCLKGATLREWVGLLMDVVAGRSVVERRKLLHDNAVRFYGLG